MPKKKQKFLPKEEELQGVGETPQVAETFEASSVTTLDKPSWVDQEKWAGMSQEEKEALVKG